MTREEALEVIKSHPFLFASFPDDVIEALDVLIKQEPVMDKIRAEIEGLEGKYVIGDYGIYGENSPKYVQLWEVLQILDKYTAKNEKWIK